MTKLISKHIKDPAELTRKLIFVLIILIGLLAISILLLGICGAKDIFVDSVKLDASFDLSDREASLEPTLDFGNHYIDSTIFLGDYTTKQMLDLKMLSDGRTSNQVWTGENGDIPLDSNIKNLSVYLADTRTCKPLSLLLEERQPERIIVTLGISNGVPYCDHDKFVSYYQSLIDLIKESSPDTIIILQSIFPITKSAEKQNPAISNARINQANEWICQLAQDNEIHFLYTAAALKDENGYLNPDYAAEDGINLDASGYRTVLKYIRTHGTYEK